MKKAIVIGASSGLGKEVAKLLIDDAWRLGIAARRIERLEEIKVLAPDRVELQAIDVTSDDAPQALEELIEKIGGIDLFF